MISCSVKPLIVNAMAVIASLALFSFGIAQEDAAADADIIEYAQQMPLADHSLLLAITRAGERWVAVGERGHALWSEDGEQWTQAEVVPSRATLTTVAYQEGQLWAAGHDSTIVTSVDGGETWTRQYHDPEGEPVLNLLFLDKQHGFALGAYSQLLVTRDGGATWDFQDMNETLVGTLFDPEAEPEDSDDYAAQFADLGCFEFMECHLNAMVNLGGGRLLILAERGFGFRSTDNGETWEAYRLPYEGSMFGAVTLPDQCVLAFGLRGNAFRSCDFAASWQAIDTGTESSLLGAVVDRGKVMLAGSTGAVVSGQIGADRLAARQHASGVDFSGIAASGPDRYLLVGEDGIHQFGEADNGGSEHD